MSRRTTTTSAGRVSIIAAIILASACTAVDTPTGVRPTDTEVEAPPVPDVGASADVESPSDAEAEAAAGAGGAELPDPDTSTPPPDTPDVGGADIDQTETALDDLFPDADYLWEPIPDDATIDSRSETIVEGLNAQGDPASAMLVEYGIPIHTAGLNAPLVEIGCTDDDRGVCGPERMSPIRMPPEAVPNAGSDGALVIVDTVEGTTHELWRAELQADGSWTAQWGSSNSIDGNAITENGGSGSGVSRLGGIIMVDELEAGTIPHALALASHVTCADAWRAPAWTTDGRTEADDCIEMGSRLQLDPTIDLDSLSLTDAERVIGKALQTYGGYIVDSSSTGLALFFEREDEARNGEIGPVAESIGFRWDYDPLSGLPWDQLRVLADPAS